MFESNDRAILSKSGLKHGAQGWNGIEPYSSTTRTCDLEIPRGHATVKCGKFFEVRYFLNVCVSTSHTKIISIQLPIILIHMNSLDVLPNSVAQVAAAIEEKRSNDHRAHSRNSSHPANRLRGKHQAQTLASSPDGLVNNVYMQPSRLQGRAFAAPRQQSHERVRAEAADIEQLGAALNASPRRYLPRRPPDKLKESGTSVNVVSRPAREIHKQPSSLSLGGISAGSYTILNDSIESGAGMEYVTPPSKRKARLFDSSALEGLEGSSEDSSGENLRDCLRRLRSIRSVGSMRSRKSNATGKSRWRNRFASGDRDNAPVCPSRIAPSASVHHAYKQDLATSSALGAYALGMASHVGGERQPRPRPSREGVVGIAREPDWQIEGEDGPDKNRFEFRPVRRKESGKFKEWFGGLKPGGKDIRQKGLAWL
ncbi:hypothetical protein MBLNU459_g3621t1 [Dothideomycetes sp. NU459]